MMGGLFLAGRDGLDAFEEKRIEIMIEKLS